VLVTFHYYNKIPEIINLKRGKIYFGSEFQSRVSRLHCFWAFGEAGYHDREHAAKEGVHFIEAGKQIEREGVRVSIIPLNGMCPIA
jgi:hypothetical protein